MRLAFKPTSPGVTLGLVAAMVLAQACGGGEGEHAGEPAAHLRLVIDTTQPGNAAFGPMMSLGEEVFHRSCSTCHERGVGLQPVGPDLTTSRWLGRATFGAVVHYLAHGQREPRAEGIGVPHPGVAQLSREEIRAVALFVDSLGRHSSGVSSRPSQ